MNHIKSLKCMGAAVGLFAGLFAASAALAFAEHDLDPRGDNQERRRNNGRSNDDDDDERQGRKSDDDDDDRRKDDDDDREGRKDDDDDDDREGRKDDDDDDDREGRKDDDDDDDDREGRKDDDDDDDDREGRKDDDDDDDREGRKDDDDDDDDDREGRKDDDDDDDDDDREGRKDDDDDDEKDDPPRRSERQLALGVEQLSFRDLGDQLAAEASVTGLVAGQRVVVELEATAEVRSSCVTDEVARANDLLDLHGDASRSFADPQLRAGALEVRLTTEHSREHTSELIRCGGARLDVDTVEFLDARVDVRQGERALTLLCTFVTSTADGEVASDNVECWSF